MTLSRIFALRRRPRIVGHVVRWRKNETETPVTPKPIERPPAYVEPKGTDPTNAYELWQAVMATEAGWMKGGRVWKLTRKARTRAEFLARLEDENYHGLYLALQCKWKVDERDVTDALKALEELPWPE